YQNCPIFNDGVFDVLKDRSEGEARILHLVHGEEIAAGGNVVVRRDDGSLDVIPRDEADPALIVRHDAHAEDPSLAFALSRLDDPSLAHVPMGVFRNVERSTYDDLVRAQIQGTVDGAGGAATDADLADLLAGRDSWMVEPVPRA